MVTLIASLLVSSLAAIGLAKPVVKCPVILEGRVPLNTTVDTFDTSASRFNPDFVKGANLTWFQIIQFPSTAPSKFDLPINKAIEVTIDDRSIFAPGGNAQIGFRRADLLLGNGSDESNIGVKTFHWSTKQDRFAKLNLTHEYMTVWHETNDFSANQFSFNTGLLLSDTSLDKSLWKVLDRNNNVIWSTKIAWDTWQNFAITMDMDKNMLQVYYSKGYDTLKAVTQLVVNDNSGGGQFHVGILKKPTETKTVVYDGYQESGIFEGQIHGGIFIEDSAGECISL
ncbi:hypothetical protein NLJ89_g7006 [Agrocybe chaxingu]|uniref:Glycoside hydrolase 131 catalytic N-terminal domain-containing protein n=1 Tax=Agrocybe chaxingu TaxID=84603 RepID=A0A9W8JZV4_9AGAR|nr:hypothetical protein NLJ89_g7006 [Agrocybe chaxingu]